MTIQIISEVPLVIPRAGGESGTTVPAVHHSEWAARWPWLTHGVTGRGDGPRPFDLGIFGAAAREALDRWDMLRAATGMPAAAHSRQPHRATVRLHGELPTGLHLAEPADVHLSSAAGVLLGITVADCVPVFLVCPSRRAVGVVHAGWRGIVAGVLEYALDSMERRLGGSPDDIHVHLGPSICGDCYEVSPEVHGALGCTVPDEASPVDLRSVLGRRAVAAGIPASNVSRSGHCTLCSVEHGRRIFFSHRAGDPERQVAWIGIRPDPEGYP